MICSAREGSSELQRLPLGVHHPPFRPRAGSGRGRVVCAEVAAANGALAVGSPAVSRPADGQVVVLILMVWISVDFARSTGFWVEPRPRLGLAALVWSGLYFTAMIARYVIRMARRPDQRWFGGTIPIIFHCFVAAFQWTFGIYHATSM